MNRVIKYISIVIASIMVVIIVFYFIDNLSLMLAFDNVKTVIVSRENSPDNRYVAIVTNTIGGILGDEIVSVYLCRIDEQKNIKNMRPICQFNGDTTVNIVWRNNKHLIIQYTTKRADGKGPSVMLATIRYYNDFHISYEPDIE